MGNTSHQHSLFILEDDTRLLRLFQRTLEQKGFLVTTASSIQGARETLNTLKPDLAIFDLLLPDGRSDILLSELRGIHHDYPIIFLSGHSEVNEKINGLERGADDFLPKPIDPRELVLRIEAILKRSASSSALKRGPYSFDDITSKVYHKERELYLQPKEFSVLKFLALHERQTIDQETLLKEIWNLDFDPQTKIVAVCVSRLRKSLLESFNVSPVSTIHGKGYIFDSSK